MADSGKGLGFARALLEKYGWKEGKGLGRNEDGIVQALKPALKLDNAGIGHNGDVDQFTSRWWEQAYNKVAKTINILQSKDDVQVQLESNQELFKSKDTRPISMYTSTDYNAFVKTSLLTGEGVIKLAETELNTDPFPEEDVAVGASTCLSDEEIFRACGGRTVHKGARHGFKLNGKLARIQRQEEELLLKSQLHQPNSASECEEEVESQKANKYKITNYLEGTTNGIALKHVLPCEERKGKKRNHSPSELNDNLKLSKREKKRKKIILNEVTLTETVSATSVTLHAMCSSAPLISEVYSDDNTTERKKRKREIEENGGIVSCDMTDPIILKPPKQKQKKREEYVETADSELTEPLILELQKKKKKEMQGEEDDCILDSEMISPFIPETQKKNKRKVQERNEGVIDSGINGPLILRPQEKRKQKMQGGEDFESDMKSEITNPLILEPQKKQMKKKSGNHRTRDYLTV